MNEDDMVTLAKIVKDSMRIREESFDKVAADEATAEAKGQRYPCVDYSQFYALNTVQAAHEAIKIHAPKLSDIDYPEDGITSADTDTNDEVSVFKGNKADNADNPPSVNLFAYFVDLAMHWSNDMQDWADIVLSLNKENSG